MYVTVMNRMFKGNREIVAPIVAPRIFFCLRCHSLCDEVNTTNMKTKSPCCEFCLVAFNLYILDLLLLLLVVVGGGGVGSCFNIYKLIIT